ncbi:MAG: malto-oligosyltrehalose trehalohydrolase, partial [Gammaproteobacteria bacterium]|nr:malto-oligosyltrehalose trehalohydrolase [Gammaproteobacteria bacterium]
MKSTHVMPFGATVLDNDQGVRFSLWAPGVEQLMLALGADDAARTLPMPRDIDGWHRLDVPEARPGDDYRFVLPDGLRVPDPASRYNPADVHGASRVVDPHAFAWTDGAWRGRPWHEAVVYEMHVGAFTPEGTFAAAQRRLPELAELGITAVELMPLADFPGHRGWGYDGVLLYAPDSSYGTPDELKSLIDAAHAIGIMMFIDVVYNHFGPEGNYLHAYCPQFFNPNVHTPWGAAINYDGPYSRTVRDFAIHNALYWIEEFHFDGLRMDAIHAIRDESETHLITEICQTLRAGPGAERAIHLVLENEHNQASLLERNIDDAPRIATAQWNDDIHHAVHVFSSGETDGYYIDFAEAPVQKFAVALAEGFIFQGQPSVLRDGEPRGEPTSQLPLGAFVSFLQTHDQIGNRAFGDRIHAIGDPVLLRAAYACVMLSPHVPMLFMGEEYAASTPFQYFCEFGPELADAVSKGRRAEFGRFAIFADEAARSRIPDPNAASTFEASKLRWDERQQAPHDAWLAQMRELLDLRRRLITPRLASGRSSGRYEVVGDGTIRVTW